MGWFDNDSDEAQAHDQLTNGNPHKSSISHELLAGGAAFEAARAYEKHVAANGKPDDHAMAKELLAGFAGAFIDREVETKGLDFIDKERAKREARQSAEQQLSNSGDYS